MYLKFLHFFILLSFFNSFSIVAQKNDATNINLQNSYIDEETEILLDTNWSFYWNQLVEPGDFNGAKRTAIISLNDWTTLKLPSFGYATYRLKFHVSEDKPVSSLYIPRIYSSSKVWINGKFVSELGKVGKQKKETLHRRFSQIIPLKTNQTDFEIVIQVANFYHAKAGITSPLILSSSQHLYAVKSKGIIADMIFIGSIGFIGCFFLLFYLFYWSKDKAVLYFAIFCISLTYMSLSDRYAPLSYVFESINWVFLTKIEYISLFLAGTTASLFFNDLFLNFTYKRYSKIIIYIFYLLCVLVVFLPRPFFTRLVFPFLVLMMINIVYFFYVIIKAIIAKRYESILLLISIVFGAIVFFIHIYFFLGQNTTYLLYINFGYVLVFLLASMLLMTRFSNSFKELESSKELAISQKEEIIIKSKELSIANLKLEENLTLLENNNKELDDFNHIVSHDLKSPLVSVYSLVSFIEQDLKDTLNESTKNYLDLLKGVVSKMDALIKGLLDYSKIAKGNKKKELFSLNSLLSEVIGVVDYQNKSEINLPENDIEIYANKVELSHVFQNLITNAIKHNDKIKAIINISVIKKQQEYLFSVSDNGPGIEEQYHAKIFKIFSQLKVNKDVESTGIGLAIVKKIIEENKGVISVDSKIGAGVTISFSWKIK